MRRREFITLLGRVAAAWPLAASAQQAEHVRRIGVLAHVAESDPVYQDWVASFRDALAKLGWIEGRDLRINYRWAGDDAGKLPAYAAKSRPHRRLNGRCRLLYFFLWITAEASHNPTPSPTIIDAGWG
jgi:hypothetical protein